MINRPLSYFLCLAFLLRSLNCLGQLPAILSENNYLAKQGFHSKNSIEKSKPMGNFFVNLQSLDSTYFERLEFSSQKCRISATNLNINCYFMSRDRLRMIPGLSFMPSGKLKILNWKKLFYKAGRNCLLYGKSTSSFSFDALFKSLKYDGRYLILGFYQNRKGLREAGNHAEIKTWAQKNRPEKFSAKDLFNPPVFKIIGHRYFIHTSDFKQWFPIGDNRNTALRKHCRYLPLIGGDYQDWKGIPRDDILMGILELNSGTTYPNHRHPAPEIYYILQGSAKWWVNGNAIEVKPGHTIYHPPHAIHKMINTRNETLQAVYFWWAPFADRARFEGYEFVE